MYQMFTGMFGQRSSRHKVSKAFPFTVAWVTHSFLQWMVDDINNDEKATGNHSEETVVSSYVVLLVISRCICIVFSDDLSLLTL
jgi:hypothetical protein